MSESRQRQPSRSLAGMTLAEVIIASVISSALAIGAVATSIFLHKEVAAATRFNQVNRETRQVADVLARDVRGAVSIEPSYSTFSATTDTLILKLPAVNASGDAIDIDTSFDHIVYHPNEINGTRLLVRDVFPAAGSIRDRQTTVIGDSVDNSAYVGTFLTKPDALGAYVIHYQFAASRQQSGRSYQVPVSGSVRLRNKL